jgi:hypothetical protein
MQKLCSFCESTVSLTHLRCSRCKFTYYCSKECQLKAWPTHKLVCLSPIESTKSYEVLKAALRKLHQDLLGLDLIKKNNLREIAGDYIADNPHLIDSLLLFFNVSVEQQIKFGDLAMKTASKVLDGVKSRAATEGIIMDAITEATLFPRIFAESLIKIIPINPQLSTLLASPLDIRGKSESIHGTILSKIFSKGQQWAIQEGPYEKIDANEWVELVYENCIRFDSMRLDFFPSSNFWLGGTKSEIRTRSNSHFIRWESIESGIKKESQNKVTVITKWAWLDAEDISEEGFLANEYPALHDLVNTRLYSLPFELNRRIPGLKLEIPKKCMVSIHVDTITVTSGLLSCQSSMSSNVLSCPINDTLLIEAHPLLEKDVFSGCDIAAVKNGYKLCVLYSVGIDTSQWLNSNLDIQTIQSIYTIKETDGVKKVTLEDDNHNKDLLLGKGNSLFFYTCHNAIPSLRLKLKRLLINEDDDQKETSDSIKIFTIKYFIH